MDQSTVIVFALAGVLVVAIATVVLLGRNASRSDSTETVQDENVKVDSASSNAKEVEEQTKKENVVVREKPDEEQLGISRRKFLNRSLYGVLGLGVLPPFGLSLLAFLVPSGKGGFGGIVNVTTPLADIISTIKSSKKPFYIPEARAYIVQYPKDNAAAVEAAEKVPEYTKNPKIIKGMADYGIVALYQKCPHLGCRVPWCETSQWFECPCHGSKYNRVGEKTGGPAPRGMDRFPFDVVGGKIVINTNLSTVVSGPPIGVDTTRQGAEGPLCV
ncbi:MAG: Rieske 2Fe-2S domain-containing protein [Acidimicrobiia bacterium]